MQKKFGSMYICEELFSKMKYIKSKIWLKLTDGPLDSLLGLACSNIQANMFSVACQKQQEKSH